MRSWIVATLAGVTLLATPTVAAQDASSAATPATLASGQRVEGPIPLNSSFAVAYYYLGETSDGSRLVGEMENTGQEPAVAPTLHAQGLDENGTPYGDESYIFNDPIVLAPGEHAVFNGSMGSGLPPAAFGLVQFAGDERSGDYLPLPIKIEGIPARGKTKDAIGKKGSIRNTGDAPIKIGVTMSWFAPDGTALGTCFGSTRGTIPPGKALPIQVTRTIGGCANTLEGARILGVTTDDDTGYAIQVYQAT